MTCTSLLGAFLCSSTVALLEQGLSGADFTQEALDEGGVWNMLFWVYSALAHALAVMLRRLPGHPWGNFHDLPGHPTPARASLG